MSRPPTAGYPRSLGHSEAADDRRPVSAAIFGNRAVADVICKITDLTRTGNPTVTTRMVARHAGLSDSIVRPVMLRLQSAGTLAPSRAKAAPSLLCTARSSLASCEMPFGRSTEAMPNLTPTPRF